MARDLFATKKNTSASQKPAEKSFFSDKPGENLISHEELKRRKKEGERKRKLLIKKDDTEIKKRSLYNASGRAFINEIFPPAEKQASVLPPTDFFNLLPEATNLPASTNEEPAPAVDPTSIPSTSTAPPPVPEKNKEKQKMVKATPPLPPPQKGPVEKESVMTLITLLQEDSKRKDIIIENLQKDMRDMHRRLRVVEKESDFYRDRQAALTAEIAYIRGQQDIMSPSTSTHGISAVIPEDNLQSYSERVRKDIQGIHAIGAQLNAGLSTAHKAFTDLVEGLAHVGMPKKH